MCGNVFALVLGFVVSWLVLSSVGRISIGERLG